MREREKELIRRLHELNRSWAGEYPSEEETRDALAGNYCRCISQYHVLDALEKLSKKGVEA